MYSGRVRSLVADPPNLGPLQNASHVASRENPVCGDRVTLWLRVELGVIRDARFRAEGCPAAIASAACLTLMLAGRTPEEGLKISADELLGELGGLPGHKMHGVHLALETLRETLSPRES